LTLTLVRLVVLGTLYVFVFLSARLVLRDGRLVLPAALALLVVPFFAWDVVHQLTHSALLSAAVAVTLYFFLRLAITGRTRDYVGLGAAAGLGVLAKYNYEVFALSLLGAGLMVAEVRRRLFDVRLLFTVGLASAVVLPHGLWLLQRWDVVSVGLSMRAGVGAREGFLAAAAWGVGRLARASLLTVAPLGLLALLFGRPRRVALTGESALALRLLDRYLIALGVVLLLHVLCGVTRFQPRWLAPFLVPVPIWFFLRASDADVGAVRRRLFLAAVAAGVVLVMVGRVMVLRHENNLARATTSAARGVAVDR
jgi:hypothetical protein